MFPPPLQSLPPKKKLSLSRSAIDPSTKKGGITPTRGGAARRWFFFSDMGGGGGAKKPATTLKSSVVAGRRTSLTLLLANFFTCALGPLCSVPTDHHVSIRCGSLVLFYIPTGLTISPPKDQWLVWECILPRIVYLFTQSFINFTPMRRLFLCLVPRFLQQTVFELEFSFM